MQAQGPRRKDKAGGATTGSALVVARRGSAAPGRRAVMANLRPPIDLMDRSH